jgi:hypothetical protein
METRRGFVQRAAMFLGALTISGSTMILTGCADVANDLVTAFQAILVILSAAGIVPGGAVVVAALNAVLSAVQEYLNAPAADKATVGMKLALIIADAQADLQTWFTNLNLTGTLAVVIESLVSVVLSTLAGFLPPLPVPPTESVKVRAAKLLRNQIVYKPAPTIICSRSGLKSASNLFRNAFNAAETTNGYSKTF